MLANGLCICIPMMLCSYICYHVISVCACVCAQLAYSMCVYVCACVCAHYVVCVFAAKYVLSELPVHCYMNFSIYIYIITCGCLIYKKKLLIFVCGCERGEREEGGGFGCMYGQTVMNLSTGMRRSQLWTFCHV